MPSVLEWRGDPIAMTTERPSESPLSFAPRGLKREHAAAYLDVSPGTFDSLVKAGKLPKPRSFTVSNGRRAMFRWDRHELDAAFEEMTAVDDSNNTWDE